MERTDMRPKELVRAWYDAGWQGEETMRDRLATAAKDLADLEFIVWSEQRPDRTTLGALHERGVRLAGALHGRGLGKGDVLALQMPNWLEAAVLYHACAELGMVVLPIIHIYGPAEVGYILEQSGAKVLVTPDVWAGIDYTGREVDRDLLRVFVGDTCPDGAVAFEALEAEGTDDFPRPELHPDELHLLCYTSGTTAHPKGVMHSHNSILAEVRQLGEATGGRDGDTMLTPNPVGHMAGIIGALLNPCVLGERCVMMDGWNPQSAAAIIHDEKVTRTGGAPFFLTTLLDFVETSDVDVSSLGFFGCGGAGVAPSLMERADAMGWFSFRSYGSSEHPSISSGCWGDPVGKRAYTDGRILPGVEVRIVDDDENEVAAGEEGEILSRGPDMFLGYTDPALNAEALTDDGFYRTGDIGRLDAEGFLTITDRKKDIIIRGGENISAKEVEDVLMRHAKVQEAAVTSMPDERYGEKVSAFVLCPGEALTMDELQAHFKESGVARQKTPERLEVVDDFPRTLAGKVKKYVLRSALK